MSSYTNFTNVPLSLAVYLASDFYDHDPTAISATSLIKPVRQLILPRRVPAGTNPTDILQLVKSRMGSSIHDGIERVWVGGHYREAMKLLGYPDKIIDKVVVNPDPNDLPEGAIPVYMEQRHYKEFMGYKVSGKFDFVAEGRVEDFKSTGTFTWTKGAKTEDYQLQGSIYRWLAPHIITDSTMVIQFIFTNWMKGLTRDPAYPQRPVEPLKIPLLSLDDTEAFVADKIRQIERYKDAHESELPRCSDKELWRDEPVWKYYKDPTKTARSTKNFDNKAEAHARLAADGGKGMVVEVPGLAKACLYCHALPICSQAAEMVADGSLVLDN